MRGSACESEAKKFEEAFDCTHDRELPNEVAKSLRQEVSDAGSNSASNNSSKTTVLPASNDGFDAMKKKLANDVKAKSLTTGRHGGQSQRRVDDNQCDQAQQEIDGEKAHWDERADSCRQRSFNASSATPRKITNGSPDLAVQIATNVLGAGQEERPCSGSSRQSLRDTEEHNGAPWRLRR